MKEGSMPSKNHFSTLGLKPGAGEDEVKKAYRSLAKQWHPDKNHNPGAEEKFKAIGAAYEFLKSQDRRDMLTRELTKKAEAKPTPKAPSAPDYSTASTSQQPSNTAYHWDYKGTEKTSTAGPSKDKSAGKKGKGKPPHPTNGSSSATPRGWMPWANDWDNMDGPSSTPLFSDAFSNFQAFVNNLSGGAFGATFFFGADNAGFGLFGNENPFMDVGWSQARGRGRGGQPGQPRPKPPPRNVASEHGYAGGLDEDLLFAPPPEKHEAKTKQCPVCGKMVTPAAYAQHERLCGKFDAPSSDEEFSPHGRHFYSSDDDGNDDYYKTESTGLFGVPRDKDWRNTHEDVLNKIRQDRKAYEANLRRQASEEHLCQFCGRTFSELALQRHYPVCKEHVLRYGRPMNPKENSGPSPDSKFARSRRYSESIPRPNAPGPSPRFAGQQYEASSESSTSPSSPNAGPSSSTTRGSRAYADRPGNARPSGKASPPKTEGPSKKSPPGNNPGTGKPGPSTSPDPGEASKNNSASSSPGGFHGRIYQGTGMNPGGRGHHYRRTSSRGSKQ